MTNRNNRDDWYFEAELPQQAGAVDMAGGQPPMTQPGAAGDPMGTNNPMPPQGGPDPSKQPDITNDPQFPEMPEQDSGDKDFEKWKMSYIKASIKGDPEILMDMLMQVRDKELDPSERKFVEDNIQICSLRRHQDILLPSQEIRKLLKKELDRSAPATSLVNHLVGVLDKYPLLNQVYVKLNGLGGGKQDYHRKFISALIGGVQVGSGASQEDVVFEETDYSIRISTRFNAKWGDVNLGKWMLKEDDAQRYLKPAEIQRLEGGSPEEKDVLRRRVVMESISETFKSRAFVINVVGTDGTIQHLGLDLGNCLSTAYINGKLVVRTHSNDAQEAFIDEEGSIVTIPNLSIYYVKQSDGINDEGSTDTEEIEFIKHREGNLYLTAQADLIKEVVSILQGLFFKETPWNGNPTDLVTVSRCVPMASELLFRQC